MNYHVLKKAGTALLLLVTLQLLLACSGLLPQPKALPAKYLLDGGPTASTQVFVPTAVAAPAISASVPSLTVDVPFAAPAYDSRHMVYLRRPHELEAFAFHEWADTPAQMLKPLLVKALANTGRFRVVLTSNSAAESDYRLETELLRLQQDFTVHPSQVRLSMRVVLLHAETRKAMAWHEFEANVPAANDDPVAGVDAAQVAVQQVLAAIAVFSAAQIQ